MKYIRTKDTIEELCDAYVFVSYSKETHYIYEMRINLNNKFKQHLLENGYVYGAIWTDKGLIYVAKMNENGALELI